MFRGFKGLFLLPFKILQIMIISKLLTLIVIAVMILMLANRVLPNSIKTTIIDHYMQTQQIQK